MTQEECDTKYVKGPHGTYVCRSCGSEVMAIDEYQRAPIWEPGTCAGYGEVEVVKIQHPFCTGCEKDRELELKNRYRS